MGQPYVGEIRLFGGNFAPVGWAFCNGALVAISENPTLFQLIGTTYGGDGQTTFALPNLQSRVPVHQGTGPGGTYTMGQAGGVETVSLTTAQMPLHTHPLAAANTSPTTAPSSGTILGLATANQTGAINVYGPPPTSTSLNPATIQNSVGSQPHSNMQPFQVLNFIIALYGIYPPQT